MLRLTMTALSNLPTERLHFEEESHLSRRIRKGPRKQDAVDRLVLHNLREAVLYAKHYVPNEAFSEGEILSLCYDVLLKSAPRFRPSFGIRFFAFTKNRLRGAVKRHCTTLDVVKHASVKRGADSDGPTFVPFTGGADFMVNRDDSQGDIESVRTCIQGGTTEFDFVGVEVREGWRSLAPLLAKLNPRQRMVLRLVYDQGFNMQEVGDMLGISRSAVQMTHSSALETLRREFGENWELFNGQC